MRLVIIALLLGKLALAQPKQEDHVRAYTAGGIALTGIVSPSMVIGVSYNANNIHLAAHVNIVGSRRAKWGAEGGYILGQGPFLIPHVGVHYEMRQRTFMLYKEPGTPSYIDPENIILKGRLGYSAGMTTIFTTHWDRVSVFLDWTVQNKAVEYVVDISYRSKDPGVYQNKWEAVKVHRMHAQLGFIVRLTRSACDDFMYGRRGWFN